MVETRRTSRRLQAKATAAASSPTPCAAVDPPAATRASAGAGQLAAASEEQLEQVTLPISEPKTKKKQKKMTRVEAEAIEVKQEEHEQEKKKDNEEEEEEEDDEDIDQYALVAASGLNLSRCTAASQSVPVAAHVTRHVSTAELVKQRMVPNKLDSGAALPYQTFFSFDGTKRSSAAALRAEAQALEEAHIIAASRKAVAHSERQRVESQHRKSAGRRWFNFESEELTADARRDFALLRMRNYLDPKKFYKSSDHSRALPKHFQMGQVIEGAHEFHSARLTKKQRRQTFTDEIMADDDIVRYTHRVAGNIQAAAATRRAPGRPKKRRN
ncbi:unnamed protein product [Hyaloperonospora brassicae]|uniref:Fcf2 pre-rRNA processing C-terminal domain-containing protein n=1 Tax=Hyaloperonospora brassicae TaxID=162125 RepID=A0AAV0TE84_HYABA|nr:unnamed protein product [Hyaloperonospora brassicae]